MSLGQGPVSLIRRGAITDRLAFSACVNDPVDCVLLNPLHMLTNAQTDGAVRFQHENELIVSHDRLLSSFFTSDIPRDSCFGQVQQAFGNQPLTFGPDNNDILIRLRLWSVSI